MHNEVGELGTTELHQPSHAAGLLLANTALSKRQPTGNSAPLNQNLAFGARNVDGLTIVNFDLHSDSRINNCLG